MSNSLPPGVRAGDTIVLFDGVCTLCSAWSRFVVRHDKEHRLRLCAIQSERGQALLRWFGFPTDDFDTMVVVRGNRAYERSDAFLEAVGQLPFPWRLARVGKVLPQRLRDWLYRRLALNRYRLFGRSESCMIPTPEVRSHFLE